MKTKILIVEDEAITAMDIKNRLNSHGFDVVGVASRGDEAIEKAGELNPDLILMDITLKGDMDGIETAEQIKVLFDIPVIYMSAFADENTFKRIKLTNPYGFVNKPVSTELLMVSIVAAVYKHELDRKLADSEEKYRRWFEEDLTGDFIAIPEGQLLECNPAFLEIYGFKNYQEAIGWDISKFNPIGWNDVINGLKNGIKICNHYSWHERPDGKKIYVVANLAGIFNDFNELVQVKGYVFNDTKRKKAEEKNKRILDNIIEAYAEFDHDWRFIDINSKAEKIFGYKKDELIGNVLWELFPQSISSKQYQEYQRAKRENIVVRFETKSLIIGDWIEITVVPHSEGVSIYSRNINERKMAEEQKQELFEELQQFAEELEVSNEELQATTEELQVVNEELKQQGNELIELNHALQKSEEKFRALIYNSTDIIRILDKNGLIIFDSPSSSRILGYPKGSLIGKSPMEFIHPDDRGNVQNDLRDVYIKKNQGIPTEFRIRKADGTYIPVESIAQNLIDVPGIGGIVVNTHPIKDRKKVENELEENQRYLETLISNLPGVAYKCLNDSHWTMEFVSEGCFELTGYHSEDIIMNKKISFNDLIHPDDQQMVWNNIKKALEKNEPFKIVYRIVTADSTYKYVWEQGRGVFSDNGELISLEGFITDISDSIRSEMYYKTIFENTGTATIIIEEDKTVSLVNSEFEKLYGCSKEEIEGKIKWTDFVADKDNLERMKRYHELRSSDSTSVPREYEFKFMNRKREVKDIFTTVALIPGTNKRLISLLDITDNKKSTKALRESKAKLKIAMDMAKLVSWEYDFESDMFTFDDQFYALYGTSVEKEGRTKMSSEEYATRFIPPEESYLVAEEINKVLKTDDPNYFTNIEHSIIRTDGEKRYILVRLGVVQDDKGQTIKTYGVNQDITERKKAEEKIKASLKEKELLLREVHHRVKNNMQIISSLLNLQSQYLHDKADLELFIESQNRVKSMALVHERLYQSESLVRINFKDYIINLFGNLMHTYGRSINLKQNIKDIYLNIETAIPCGLIINELVTNAVKHAFPGQNNELICIELVKADNKLKLVVSDNGIGLPDDFNLDNNDSWGLQLVQMLVDQLNGEIRANSVNGAVFTILFNELNYKKRF